MEQNEFDDLVKELKDRNFIARKRSIKPSPYVKYFVFASRGGEVMYTPHALKYFMRNEICWILLHEEYHCSTFIGEIPFISESPGIKYANEKILLFDPKIILDDLLKSIGAHWREYKETLPPINKIQKFLAYIGLGDK